MTEMEEELFVFANCDSGDTDDIVQIASLLAKGISPNITDAKGQTPLWGVVVSDDGEMYVYGGCDASDKRIAVANCLLDAGCEINHQDNSGNTVLHEAARATFNGRSEVTVLLLSRGADPNMRNANGQTPLEALSGFRDREKELVREILLKSDNAAWFDP